MKLTSFVKIVLCANSHEDLFDWEQHFTRLLGAGQVTRGYGFWEGSSESNVYVTCWTDDLTSLVYRLVPELQAYQAAAEQQAVALEVYDSSSRCQALYILAEQCDYDGLLNDADPSRFFIRQPA